MFRSHKEIWLCVALSVTIFHSLACACTPVAAHEESIKPSNQSRALAKAVVDAYGGAEKLKNIDELFYRAKGNITEYSTISGASNTYDCVILSKGLKVRIQVNLGNQPIVTAFNGISGWIMQGAEVYPADATTTQQIKEEIVHGLFLLNTLTEKSALVGLLAPKTIDGKECSCLSVQAQDGKPTNFYIDPQTNLVVRSEYNGTDEETGLDTLKGYLYSDYRPVCGTYLPFKTVEYNGENKSAETTITAVELVTSFTDAVFDMPAETRVSRLAKGPVTIPFNYNANQIMVQARINNKLDGYFIVDTGATTTVLDQHCSHDLSMPRSPNFRMTTGTGSIPANLVSLDTLTLGEITLKDVPAAISELPGFNELPGLKPIGIIGANILHRFLVTIDYDQKTITLRDPHNVTVPSGATVITTKPALGMIGLALDGKLDNTPMTFLVDTGAAFNNISERLVKQLIDFPLLPVGRVEGLDGQKINIGSAEFKNIKLGDFTFLKPVFSIAPRAVSQTEMGVIDNGAIAILGNPFWSQFRTTFDYRNQRLILEKSKTRESLDDAAAELEKIYLQYWKTNNSRLASAQCHEAATRYEQNNLPAASALCLARAAYLQAEHAESANDANEDVQTDTLFEKATGLAEASHDQGTITEVMSIRALSYLKNSTPPDTAQAKGLIAKASAAAPLDTVALISLYFWFKQTGNDRSASSTLDQALMTDPSNWDALWERYNRALAQKNNSDLRLVVTQLKRYYSGIPKVAALTAN